MPLVASPPIEFDPEFFSVEQYFAARSLISSRSFEIDDYHGYGMVPLADLFNHRTGAEDVHITSTSSHVSHGEDINTSGDFEDPGDGKQLAQSLPSKNGLFEVMEEAFSVIEDDPTVLEMIVVKDVKSGSEVFNTYGSLGNAALLHRYGFTELDNPYDIVNIDLELVFKWSSYLFSSRHFRSRLSLWRRLGYSGCAGSRKNSEEEYFEISFNGEPQIELLILLYILLLPEEESFQLDLIVSTAAAGTVNGLFSSVVAALRNVNGSKLDLLEKSAAPEMSNLLLTECVCEALISLATIREGLYGSTSIEGDRAALRGCCRIRERKLYHSLVLRWSERRILEKLRSYAAAARLSHQKSKRGKKKGKSESNTGSKKVKRR